MPKTEINTPSLIDRLRVSVVVKLVIGICACAAAVYFLVFRYISNDFENKSITQAKSVMRVAAQAKSLEAQADLNAMLADTRGLSLAMSELGGREGDAARAYIRRALAAQLDGNHRYTAAWVSWDEPYLRPGARYGHVSDIMYREGQGMAARVDSVGFDGADTVGTYAQIKRSRREFLTEPYMDQYGGDEVLVASIGAPVIIGGKFAGLAGVDLVLSDFARMIDSLVPVEGAKAFLLSDNLTVIAHPDKSLLGHDYRDTNRGEAAAIEEAFRAMEPFTYEQYSGAESGRDVVVFSPLRIGDTENAWALAVSLPLKVVEASAERQMSTVNLISTLGFLLLVVITTLCSVWVVRPVKAATAALNLLAEGDIRDSRKVEIPISRRGRDEIHQISQHVNSIVANLSETVAFARKIKEGDFGSDYAPISQHDTLGHNLMHMRQSLVKANEERERRKAEDRRKNWISQGINMFAVLLRDNNDNLQRLSSGIITKLVDYVGAQAGAVYMVEGDAATGERLRLAASCGFPKEQLGRATVEPNEGVVGRCLLERRPIFIDDVPADYPVVGSGLGKTRPSCVYAAPLIINEELVSIVLVESLRPLDDYQVAFVDTVGVPIASALSMVRVNMRTAHLLEESRQQAVELQQQETEMRQNMVEMAAAHEETSRREEECLRLIRAVRSATYYVEYDINGTITDVNDRFLHLFQLTKEQLTTKTNNTYSFRGNESSDKRTRLWEKLRTGEATTQEFYTRFLGQDHWFIENYIPLISVSGQAYKVVCIVHDITDEKRKERQIGTLSNKLERARLQNAKRKGDADRPAELLDLPLMQEKMKFVQLDHLAKVYKGDMEKIRNILKIYADTVPQQIEELRQLVEAREWEQLKSRVTGFRTKVTYLGLVELLDKARQLEKLCDHEDPEEKALPMADTIAELWEEAAADLALITQTRG